MASKVSNLLKVIGRDVPDPGAHMYHAADGVGPSGAVSELKRHKIRKALHKMRLRATGMSDDIGGSKEVDGSLGNPFEKKPTK